METEVTSSPNKIPREKAPKKEKKKAADQVTDPKAEGETEQLTGGPKQLKEKKPKKADKQQMVY